MKRNSLFALLALALAVFAIRMLSSPPEQAPPKDGRTPLVAEHGASSVSPPVTSDAMDLSPANLDGDEGRMAVEPPPKEWVIGGRVFTGEGDARPAAGLLVRIVPLDSSATPVEHKLTTDDEGRFLCALPPPEEQMSLEVRGAEPGTVSTAERRTLSPGDTPPADLELRVYPLDISIEGIVSGPDGVVPGARVSWSLGETSTNVRGEYSLKASRERAEIRLVVLAPGLVKAHESLRPKHESQEVYKIDFELAAPLRISGRVVDEQAQPVAQVAVRIRSAPEEPSMTGADGRFSIGSLDPNRRSHTVFANKSGYAQACRWVATEDLPIDDLEITLEVGTKVEGLVLGENRAPLSGTKLSLTSNLSSANRIEAVSDANGLFAFSQVAAGEWNLLTSHEGYTFDQRLVRIPPGELLLPPIEVHLNNGRSARGVVQDQTGALLEGVRIRAFQGDSGLRQSETTDASGQFLFEGLPAGDLRLYFESDRTLTKVVPLPAGAVDPLVVALEPCGGLAGRVLDSASGEPITKFTVRFVFPHVLEGEEPTRGITKEWTGEGKTFDSADGTWATTGLGLKVGTVTGLEVHAPSYAPVAYSRIFVAADPRSEDLITELDRPATVHGQLLDLAGGPLARAKIIARPAASAPPSDSIQMGSTGIAQSDHEGDFRIDALAGGQHVLYVFPPDLPPFIDGPFELRPGTETYRLVRLPEEGVLEGRALAPDGSPLEGALVRLSHLGQSDPWPPYFEVNASADGEGRFAFRGLTDASYQVALSRQVSGVELYELIVEGEVSNGRGQVTLQLAGSGTVKGRLELDGGTPPEALRVRLSWRTHLPEGESSDRPFLALTAIAEDGTFELSNLPPGIYRLNVRPPPPSGLLPAGAEVTVREAEIAEVSISLKRP